MKQGYEKLVLPPSGSLFSHTRREAHSFRETLLVQH